MISLIIHGHDTNGHTVNHVGALSPPQYLLEDPNLQAVCSGNDANVADFWTPVLQALLVEFYRERPDHDTDSEFIDWLVTERGWEEVSEYVQVELQPPTEH